MWGAALCGFDFAAEYLRGVLFRLFERAANLCGPHLVSMVTVEVRSYRRMPRSQILLRECGCE